MNFVRNELGLGLLKRLSWLLSVVGSVLLASSISAPIAETMKIEESAHLYSFLRTICHQMPSRCLWYQNSNFGLCSHCFGVCVGMFFFGILFGIRKFQHLISQVSWKKVIFFIVVALAPILLDVWVELERDQMNPHYVRVITGFLAMGAVWLALYFFVFSLIRWFRFKREVLFILWFKIM